MGATYTRQSSYSDGDVIQAADTNNEFDQLLAAFAASSGHTHDGTTAEGGPITKLLGNSLTLGAGTAGTDITVTFDGESNDGVLLWKEDEDYFEFSDDILLATTEKLQFRDTAIYINSSADGQLDLVADTEIQIAATTIDMNGNADISGNLGIGGNLTVTGTTTFNGGTITMGDAATDNVVFGADVDSNIIPDDDNTYDLGSSSQEWKDIYIDGVAYLDAINFNGTAITSTAAELNIVDGGTSATSTTVADADRVVLNDNGTMVQVAVTDLAAYFDDEITAMPNLVTTAATTVGALNSGSITSGFGTIDTGSSTITTTGLITGGSLDIDDVVINGTTIGHTDDTDLITVASGIVTVAGEISVTTLDIGGTNVTSTAAELNLLDGVSGLVQADFTKLAAVDATATELNIMDGGTAASSTTLADADRVVVNDAGTMKQVALTDFETYFESALDTLSNVTTVGTLGSGAISSGFGAIDIGSSNLTATGTVSLGATSFNDNAITNVGDIALDSISADATDINVAVSDNSATAFTIKQGSDAYLIVDTANSSESVSIGTGVSGTAITIGHGTSEVTVADNLTVAGNLTVTGTTTTVSSQTINVQNAFVFEGATADAHETTLSIVDPTADHTYYLPDLGSTADDGYLAAFAADPGSSPLITSTPTELNILDGNTNASSVTLADADRIVVNDDGTMKQVALTTLNTYIGSSTTTVGALNSGSITSGFGSIDNGSSAITTTGTITYGSLSDGTITITAFVDEDGMDSNSATLVPTQQSVKAYVDDNRNVTGLNATGAEINTVADASAISIDTSTAIANNDAILMYDNSATAMKYFDVDLLDTYYTSTTQTLSNKTLTAPKIVDGGFIADANGNEIIMLQTASSAVNQLEVTNAATGGAIVVGASGDDSNIDIDISPKGTGEVNIAAGNLNYAGTAVTSTGAELNILDGVTSTATELNILDGVTSTTAELNIMDGDTAASSITLADADRLVLNDGGTMKQIALTTLKTYLTAAGYATTDDATALAIALG